MIKSLRMEAKLDPNDIRDSLAVCWSIVTVSLIRSSDDPMFVSVEELEAVRSRLSHILKNWEAISETETNWNK